MQRLEVSGAITTPIWVVRCERVKRQPDNFECTSPENTHTP